MDDFGTEREMAAPAGAGLLCLPERGIFSPHLRSYFLLSISASNGIQNRNNFERKMKVDDEEGESRISDARVSGDAGIRARGRIENTSLCLSLFFVFPHPLRENILKFHAMFRITSSLITIP